MNYQKIYRQLIDKAKLRQDSKNRRILKKEIGSVEQHHIVPRCIGGTNDKINLIFLTPEEHLVAHLLLVKIYKHPLLIYAANWMTSRVKNNKEYGWVKRSFAVAISRDFTGKPRTKESVDKQKETVKERNKNGYVYPTGRHITENHKIAISEANKGKSVETKSKCSLEGYILRYGIVDGPTKYKDDSASKDSHSISAYVKKYGYVDGPVKYKDHCEHLSFISSGENNHFYGKVHTPESRDKISNANTGKSKIRTQEHNNKIGDAHRGKIHKTVTCPHCNKEGGCTTMPRWHFDNCTMRPGGPKKERTMSATVTCPCCGKIGNGPRMKSDHFDNCKQKS